MRHEPNERDGSIFIKLCRRALISNIAKIILLDIIGVTAYLNFTLGIPLESESKAVTVLYLIISAAAGFFIAYRLIKNKISNYDSFAEIIYAMDFSGFDRLCRQAEGSVFKYNTFFLLDDCFFIPSQMLLLEYTDISDIEPTYDIIRLWHIVPVYVGAKMQIICFNGKKYKLNIKNTNEFRKDYDNFIWLLNKKRKSCFERKNIINSYNDLEVLK